MSGPDLHARLAHQALGRKLSAEETALADALEAIYISGATEGGDIAHALTERGVAAPVSGGKHWDVALLERELSAINASLDQAYGSGGTSA